MYWNGTAFSYDGMDRLNVSYTYDAINNITAGPSATYTYRPIGAWNTMQLATATIGGTARTVSDDGNLGNITAISGKLTELKYDAFNRLISLKDPTRPNGSNPSDEFFYDPFGRRYARIETAVDGTRTTTYYLYEGNSILYEETWVNNALTKSILNLYLGGMNIGRYVKAGGVQNLQYFYNDHLGSRRAVTNATGTVQAKIDYSVWGVPTVTNYNGYDGSRDISYTGKEYDATKLYYFNARYYDPSMGRFITEDPARDEMNWYEYCGNNPLSFTDPTGLVIDPDTIGGGGATIKQTIGLDHDGRKANTCDAQHYDPDARPGVPYTQKALPSTPGTGKNEACRIRSIFRIAELAKGENFSYNELNSIWSECLGNGEITEESSVELPTEALRRAFSKMKLNGDPYFDGQSNGAKGSIVHEVKKTKIPSGSFSVHIAYETFNHFAVGSATGNKTWDPWSDVGVNGYSLSGRIDYVHY
jgi:RHS repeat-associated protein